MRWISAALILPTIGWLACTKPDSRSRLAPVISDSAGITIFDYSRQLAAEAPAWELDSVPLRVIGEAGSDPAEQLYFVRSVVELPNGNVVIANGGSNDLRWFGPDGQFVRSSGTNGEGPGEFRGLTGLSRMAPDSLLAYDSSLKRFQVFDSAGQYVRSFTFYSAERAIAFPEVLAVSSAGQLVIRDLRSNAPEATISGRVRLTYDILLYDRNGRMLDSIASPSAWEAFNPEPVNGIRVSTLAVPFGFNTLLGATNEYLVFGNTEANEVRALAFDGQLHRILRPPVTNVVKVSQADAESYRKRALANVPPSAKQLFADIYAQMPMPESKPRMRWLEISPDGTLWIIAWPATGLAPSEALIFDSDWNLSGRLNVPRGFEPAVVSSNRVIGVFTNDLGVEEVHEYHLKRNR